MGISFIYATLLLIIILPFWINSMRLVSAKQLSQLITYLTHFSSLVDFFLQKKDSVFYRFNPKHKLLPLKCWRINLSGGFLSTGHLFSYSGLSLLLFMPDQSGINIKKMHRFATQLGGEFSSSLITGFRMVVTILLGSSQQRYNYLFCV